MTERAATAPEPHLVPTTSGGLLVNGVVTSGSSFKGAGDAKLHPLVDAFLWDIPIEHREMFRFNCTEAVLVSDAITALESESGGVPPTWGEAAAYCSGGKVFATLVRERFDPAHGTPAKPCKSCAYLLGALGIEVLES